MKTSYNLEEAYYQLRIEGLDEVMKVLNLKDDDVADILLNDCPDKQVMQWFVNHQHDTALDLAERQYSER